MMSSQAAVGPGLKAEASVEAPTSSCDVRNKTVNGFGLYGEFSASEQLYGSFISLNFIKMRSYNIMLHYGTLCPSFMYSLWGRAVAVDLSKTPLLFYHFLFSRFVFVILINAGIRSHLHLPVTLFLPF